MTVATTQSQTTLLGNGSTTSFGFNFIGVAASDIYVIYNNGTTLTPLAPSSYTLVLNPPATNQIWGVGGSVTYPVSGPPIPNGTQLIIGRTVPLLQSTSLTNQGDSWPTVIEAALDTLCFEIQQISNRTGQIRGIWKTATAYSYGDFVQDGANGANTQNYYMCAIANTSGTWSTDLASGDWSLAIDVQQIIAYRDQAAASAAAALVSQLAAASSASSASSSAATATAQAVIATAQAGIATTEAGIATTQANNAAASAVLAQNYAAALTSTSTTSVSIGTGSKTFMTQSSKQYAAGQFISISSNASALNYMHGQVTSYSGTTLVVNVTDIGGSGTHADWNISVSGSQGPVGPGGGGSGTVTSVSVASANGFSGTVSSPTTTPNITMSTSVSGVLKGNGTAISAATPGTDYLTVLSGDVTTSGNASTIKTNVALAGSPTTTTQSLGDNSTKIATTAFVAANGPIYNGSTTSGTANAQTASATGFTLAANNGIIAEIGSTNTTAMTLNVNATGVKNVYVASSSGPIACVGGEAAAGNVGLFIYDGTGYQLLSLGGGGGGFTGYFKSSQETITFSSVLTPIVHGLPAAPTLLMIDLVCITAEFGYSIGDLLNINPATNNNNAAGSGISVTSDTTNIYITYGGQIGIIHKSSGAGENITAANWKLVVSAWSGTGTGGSGISGKTVQQVYNEYNTYTSGSNAISYDDTIPTSSDGTPTASVSITPTSATNYLVIEAVGNGTGGGTRIVGTLNQSGVTNSLVANGCTGTPVATGQMTIVYKMLAGTTSPITFTLNIGDSITPYYINGNSGGRIYGGAQKCTILVTEVTP